MPVLLLGMAFRITLPHHSGCFRPARRSGSHFRRLFSAGRRLAAKGRQAAARGADHRSRQLLHPAERGGGSRCRPVAGTGAGYHRGFSLPAHQGSDGFGQLNHFYEKRPVSFQLIGLFQLVKEKQKTRNQSVASFQWWTIQESNLLPPVRQTGALAK